MAVISRESVVDLLFDQGPKFHSLTDDEVISYAIQRPVLEWFVRHLPSDARTLETGCGYTTVVLACLAARHTTISPGADEHQRIRHWCESHDLSLAHVQFFAERSQAVLPGLSDEPLDCVLIDGDHAFPAPFIDWYYTAERIVEGGHVIIDDVQIPTGGILRDFLAQEEGRWRAVAEIDKTCVFQKITSAPVAVGMRWMEQPFCRIPVSATLRRVGNRLRSAFTSG
ncbi:MAG: class I SAM-dependent methyltransferase [Gammaproteobacteria bacterium]|nr:class I SAM-dependent methyltransferase [Gammaproteobacteria bacterium]